MNEGSNTLHIVLPPGMGLHAATAAFGQFGDVAKVEVLPSDFPTATVSFFDVRAATRAREVLGDHWCWPGEQCGERTARLPGTMQLSEDDLLRVSGVRQDSAGSGYVVEFFDVRDAARVSAACRKISSAASQATASVQPNDLKPAYINADKKSEVSVLLQGLPNAMCSPTCFEAMLEQAGLAGEVLSHSIRPSTPCGEAVLKVSSENAASRCIKHFHGRVWDLSGTPVSATRLAPPPGLPCALKEESLSSLPSMRPSFLPGQGEVAKALVPPPGLDGLSATKDADSEESTDAGASDAGECHDEYLGEGCSIVVA